MRTIPLLVSILLTQLDQPPQPPVFPKPAMTGSVGRILDIQASLPMGVPFTWAIPDQPGIDFRSAGLTGYLFPQQPGTYFIGIAYGNPIQHSWMTVKIDGQPGNPAPQPPPNPGPVSGPLTIIVAFDKIPTLPPYSGFTPLTDYMLAKNHKWKLVDKEGKDSRGVALNPQLANAIIGKTLPYAVVVDGSSVRASQALPANGEEMLKLIQSVEK